MKEYLKPEVEIVNFATEAIADVNLDNPYGDSDDI